MGLPSLLCALCPGSLGAIGNRQSLHLHLFLVASLGAGGTKRITLSHLIHLISDRTKPQSLDPILP